MENSYATQQTVEGACAITEQGDLGLGVTPIIDESKVGGKIGGKESGDIERGDIHTTLV